MRHGAAPATAARTTVVAQARAATDPPRATPSGDPRWVERVYPRTPPDPVWFTPEGPRAAVGVALRELRAAGDRGLASEDYDADALERDVEAAMRGARAPDAIARVDRALSATMLRFLADLRSGRVRPRQVEPFFHAPAKPMPFAADLREAVAGERLASLIAEAEPTFAQYAQLKRLLADYRILAAQPLPRALGSPRGKIVVGDRHASVPALRATLVALGDLPADTADAADPAATLYSATLAAAVRRFQSRHGLAPDGIVGKGTLDALNTPVAARIEQITLSLERLRWLPDFAAGPLIAVNIPSFELWAFADATGTRRATLSMPVVVGRAMRNETPVFIGEMRYVEFSPYWNVPPSILHNELLPRIAEDPSYLRREDMEIVRTGRNGTRVRGERSRRHRGLADGQRAAAPASGSGQRAGRRQVRVAQHDGHLSACHAGARAVRAHAARLQPWLHPRARTRRRSHRSCSAASRNGRPRRSRRR